MSFLACILISKWFYVKKPTKKILHLTVFFPFTFQFASSLTATEELSFNSSSENINTTTLNTNATRTQALLADNRTETSGNTSRIYAPSSSPYDSCMLPSYFSHFAILILIATTIVTQLSHLTKILLMVIITGKIEMRKIIEIIN